MRYREKSKQLDKRRENATGLQIVTLMTIGRFNGLINYGDKKKQRFDVNIQNLLSALFSAEDSHNWFTIVSVKGTIGNFFNLFNYRVMLKFYH